MTDRLWFMCLSDLSVFLGSISQALCLRILQVHETLAIVSILLVDRWATQAMKGTVAVASMLLSFSLTDAQAEIPCNSLGIQFYVNCEACLTICHRRGTEPPNRDMF